MEGNLMAYRRRCTYLCASILALKCSGELSAQVVMHLILGMLCAETFCLRRQSRIEMFKDTCERRFMELLDYRKL